MLKALLQLLHLGCLCLSGTTWAQNGPPITQTVNNIVPVPGGTVDLGTFVLDDRRIDAISMQPSLIRLTNIGQHQQLKMSRLAARHPAMNPALRDSVYHHLCALDLF